MNSTAQVFLGVQANNLGIGFHTGYQLRFNTAENTISEDALLFTIGTNHPMVNSQKPSLYYSTIGLMFANSNRDAFNITLSTGASFGTSKNFNKYDINPNGHIDNVNKFYSNYNIELGKDWYLGRVYINASYSKFWFFGIGIKGFFLNI